MSGLIKSQDQLDSYLKRLVDSGRPLRGLLVIEYAAEPLPSGIWRRTGTYRIGKNDLVHSQILSDNWVIKSYGLTSEALQLEEQATVIANEVPDSVRRALDIAGVEWGRADHAQFRGRQIIFEVNTNPMVRSVDPHGHVIRTETLRTSFSRTSQSISAAQVSHANQNFRLDPFWLSDPGHYGSGLALRRLGR